MWRACRLVIDTGIHAFEWSRERSIEYLLEHATLTIRDVESEVDRYIAWPAQALSYKIGQIRIRELRREAQAELGDSFSLPEFHRVILGHGPLPCSMLRYHWDLQ